MRPDLPPPREQDQEMLDRIMEPKSGPKYLMEELIFPYVREGYEDLMQAFEPIDEFREELRIPDYGNPVFEGQHSPTLVLALFSEHFAATQPDWPAQTRITGFAFYDGQVAEQASVCVESQRSWCTSAE